MSVCGTCNGTGYAPRYVGPDDADPCDDCAGPGSTYIVDDVESIELVGFHRRDHFVGWLANQVLRLASPKYQAMIGGSIRYGLAAAVLDNGRAIAPEEPDQNGRSAT